MAISKIKKTFAEHTQELIDTTTERDMYEIEYELEKARLMGSAETMAGLGSQQQRDAKMVEILDDKGMYRKMAELRLYAKLAWYKWATIKTLIEHPDGFSYKGREVI